MSKSREVEGVLATGPAGELRDGRWWLQLRLEPWCEVGVDEASMVPLHVDVPVSEDELHEIMMRVFKGRTVRLTLDELHAPTRTRWQARGRLPVANVVGELGLRSAAVERSRPIVVRDPDLGELVLDRETRAFDGHVEIAGRRCAVTVARSGRTEDAARDARDVANAREVIAMIDRRFRSIRAAVAREVSDLYNETWRGKRRVLRSSEIAERIRLNELDVSRRKVRLWFSDGRLFRRHMIEAHLVDDVVREARIVVGRG